MTGRFEVTATTINGHATPAHEHAPLEPLEDVGLLDEIEWDTSNPEFIATFQDLIYSGAVWRIEGVYGQTAMRLINERLCELAPVPHIDAYGSTVPDKDWIEPGPRDRPSTVRRDQRRSARETHFLRADKANLSPRNRRVDQAFQSLHRAIWPLSAGLLLREKKNE